MAKNMKSKKAVKKIVAKKGKSTKVEKPAKK